MADITPDKITVQRPITVAAPDALLQILSNPNVPLGVGTWTFTLEVVDNAGNRSAPQRHSVTVLDADRPTARIVGPREVKFGEAFTLSGAESTDVPPGRIVQYIWTLVDRS